MARFGLFGLLERPDPNSPAAAALTALERPSDDDRRPVDGLQRARLDDGQWFEVLSTTFQTHVPRWPGVSGRSLTHSFVSPFLS